MGKKATATTFVISSSSTEGAKKPTKKKDAKEPPTKKDKIDRINSSPIANERADLQQEADQIIGGSSESTITDHSTTPVVKQVQRQDILDWVAKECKRYGKDWTELHSDAEWFAKNQQLLDVLNMDMINNGKVLQERIDKRVEQERVGFNETLPAQGL